MKKFFFFTATVFLLFHSEAFCVVTKSQIYQNEHGHLVVVFGDMHANSSEHYREAENQQRQALKQSLTTLIDTTGVTLDLMAENPYAFGTNDFSDSSSFDVPFKFKHLMDVNEYSEEEMSLRGTYKQGFPTILWNPLKDGEVPGVSLVSIDPRMPYRSHEVVNSNQIPVEVFRMAGRSHSLPDEHNLDPAMLPILQKLDDRIEQNYSIFIARLLGENAALLRDPSWLIHIPATYGCSSKTVSELIGTTHTVSNATHINDEDDWTIEWRQRDPEIQDNLNSYRVEYQILLNVAKAYNKPKNISLIIAGGTHLEEVEPLLEQGGYRKLNEKYLPNKVEGDHRIFRESPEGIISETLRQIKGSLVSGH